MDNNSARILVVDDDLIFGKNLCTILIDKGFKVELAGTGNKAIEVLGLGHFDIVLLDIKLPDINGIEVFKKIKEAKARTAVIVMSAYPFDKEVMDTIQEESLIYFCKPFDINAVLNAIKKFTT
jgi:DNA-binding response OmpR family regulator